MEALQAEKVPAGVVQTGADLVKDPQLRHRDYFERFTDSPIGSFEVPRSALQFSGMVDEPLSLPARLGANTDEILRDLLGYDDDTIAAWRKEEILS
jgi:crotonobetainyl-CoA:carnitine CoA-transferase CaiB-like acyl-CoA transferase